MFEEPDANGFTWNGNAIIGYSGNAGNVVIPANATEIQTKAFYNNKTLQSLTFANGGNCIAIGADAFNGCSLLSTVTLPDTIREIGANAFRSCAIAEIALPADLTTIGRNAFRDNSTLKTVDIRSKQISEIGYNENDTDYRGDGVFSGCSINNVRFNDQMTYIPSFLFNGAGFEADATVSIPAQVTEVKQQAFYLARNLTHVVFADPSKCVTIGYYAFGATGLTDINIPSGVVTIEEGGFYGTKLKSVGLPASLTTIGAGAFRNSTLESVTIPEKVTTIGRNAFRDNSTLKTVDIRSKQISEIGYNENDTVYRGDGVFSGCSINSVRFNDQMTYIPSYLFSGAGFEADATVNIPAQVTEVKQQAFYLAKNLAHVVFADPSKCVTIGNYAFCSTGLIDVNIPSGVVTIGECGFYGTKLKSVELPASLTTIGAGAFRSSALESVTIPEKVTTIGRNAFRDNSTLKTVDIRSKQISEVGYNENDTDYRGDGVFSGCSINSVKFNDQMTYIPSYLFNGAGFEADATVNIPAQVTEVKQQAFYLAKNLAHVVFADDSKCETIGYWAFGSTGLVDVNIPSGVVTIGECGFYGTKLKSVELPASLTTIGAGAFRSCALESVTIPEKVTTIGRNAFRDNSTLKTVDIRSKQISEVGYNKNDTEYRGDGVFSGCSINSVKFNDQMTYIPSYLFSGAGIEAATEITIPQYVTQIGERSFYKAGKLQKIVLPAGLREIGKDAFAGCDYLDTVVFEGTSEAWDKVAVGTGNDKISSPTEMLNKEPAVKPDDPEDPTDPSDPSGSWALPDAPTEPIPDGTEGLTPNYQGNVLAVKGKVALNAGFTVKKWTVSSKKLASVSKKGVVTAKKPGKVTVTAKEKGGERRTKTWTLYIEKPRLSGGKLYSMDQFSAKTKLSNVDKLRPTRFKSSRSSVLSVAADGTLTAKKSGKATITIYFSHGKVSAKYTVKLPYIKQASVKVETGATKSLKLIGGSNTPNLKWVSSDDAVATVSETGVVTGIATGSVTVSLMGGDNVYDTCQVIVK